MGKIKSTSAGVNSQFPYCVGDLLRYTGSIYPLRTQPKYQKVKVVSIKRKRISGKLLPNLTVQWVDGGQRFDLGLSSLHFLSLWELP